MWAVLFAIVTQVSTACNHYFGLQLTSMQFIMRPQSVCDSRKLPLGKWMALVNG